MLSIVPLVPTTLTPPSQRSRELGGILSDAIRTYEREHPSLSGQEIRAALRLAEERRAGPAGGPVVALLAGLAALGVVLFMLSAEGEAGVTPPWTLIAGVAGLILAVLMVFLRRRGP